MANEILRCGVCNRASNEVRNLIAAPLKQGGEVLICDRCNGEIADAMAEENRHRQKAAVKEEPLRKPREIKAFLDQHVIAQERAKQDVAVAVYNHFKRRDRARSAQIGEGVEIQKSNILLLGPSGTGKTELFRAIARMLKVPFYVADATRLTQAGYVGDDVESMLQGLLQAANGDPEKAQWGIVFIDEFDKLARKSGRGASGYRDVSGEGVQQSLLKLIEGSTVPVPRGMGKGGNVFTIGADGTAKPNLDMLDTTNVLFVCAGSFDGIQETVERRINKGSRLGFGSPSGESSKRKLDLADIYSEVTEDDILDFGIIPELLGRLPVRTSTLPLTDTDMVRVLTEPKHSIIKQFKALFAYDSIDLVFKDDALLEIGRLAKSRPTGARALRSIVEDLLRPYSFDAPSDTSIASITITADVVKGGKAEVGRRPIVVVSPAEATG